MDKKLWDKFLKELSRNEFTDFILEAINEIFDNGRLSHELVQYNNPHKLQDRINTHFRKMQIPIYVPDEYARDIISIANKFNDTSLKEKRRIEKKKTKSETVSQANTKSKRQSQITGQTSKKVQVLNSEKLKEDLNSLYDSIENLKIINRYHKPLSLRVIRELSEKSYEGKVEGLERVKRFSLFSRLFYPKVAAHLSNYDLKHLTKFNDKEFRRQLETLKLDSVLLEVELSKFREFMVNENGEFPTEIEFTLRKTLPKPAKNVLRNNRIFTIKDGRQFLLYKKSSKLKGEWVEKLKILSRLSFATSNLTVLQVLNNNHIKTLSDLFYINNKTTEELARKGKIPVTYIKHARKQAGECLKALNNEMTTEYYSQSYQYRMNYQPGDPALGTIIYPDIDIPELEIDMGGGDWCESCMDCRSVLSKAAYMVDLINTIGSRYGLTIKDLEQGLYRDFTGMSVDCEKHAELIPKLVICVEVLERYILKNNSNMNSLSDIHEYLYNSKNENYKNYLRQTFTSLSLLIDLPVWQLNKFIKILRDGESQPGDDKFRRDINLKLGLDINAPSNSNTYPTDYTLANAGTIRTSLKSIDPDNLNFQSILTLINQIEKINIRRLYSRWQYQDSLLQNDYDSNVLYAKRSKEINNFLNSIPDRTNNALRSSVSYYLQALDDHDLLNLGNRTFQELLDDLSLTFSTAGCDAITRLEEAIISLQLFFKKKVLSHDQYDRSTEPSEWEIYNNYETWKGVTLPKVYPELFYGELEKVMVEQMKIFHHDVQADDVDNRIHVRQYSDAVNGRFQGDNTANLYRNGFQGAVYSNNQFVKQELSKLHELIWYKLKINTFMSQTTQSEVERFNSLFSIASKPEKILGLELCDWIFLQRKVIDFWSKAYSIPGFPHRERHQKALIDYNDRILGFDPNYGKYNNPYGYLHNPPHVHLLTFYLLPRLWGRFYYYVQDHDKAARFYHLIYNEEVENYDIPGTHLEQPDALNPYYTVEVYDSNPIGPIIYEHLRKFNPYPAANNLNRYNVEVKDICTLIAQNYVDWADLEMRKNTTNGREKARFIYNQALRVIGQSEYGRNIPNCEDDCSRIAEQIMINIISDLPYATNSLIKSKWQIFKANNSSRKVLQSLASKIWKISKLDISAESKSLRIDQVLNEFINESEKITLNDFLKNSELQKDNLEIKDSFLSILDSKLGHIGESKNLTYDNYGHDRDYPSTEPVYLTPNPDGGGFEPGGIPEPGEHPRDPFDEIIDRPFDDPFDDRPDLVDETTVAVCENDVVGVKGYSAQGFCVPVNPKVKSLLNRACTGIRLIEECRNFLGYPNEFVPIFRFSHLVQMAEYFSNLARNAEQDFIRFTESIEQDVINLLKETQALQVSQSTVALHQTMLSQAFQQADLADLQSERVDTQQEQVTQQILEGATDLEELAIQHLNNAIGWQATANWLNVGAGGTGLIVGALAGGLGAGTFGSAFGPQGTIVGGAGGVVLGGALGLLASGPGAMSSLAGAASGMASIESTQAQIAQINNSIQQRLDELNRTSELLEIDARIANQNIAIANTGITIANQQLAIAEINVSFAEAIVNFMKTRFFRGETYDWMASITKDNYRILLNYAITAAWMAERSLEFERQQQINVIRFDYWRETKQGLMAVDQLITDIATLKNEQILNERRKNQMTKTISIAQISPIELAQFRKSGQIGFTTLEEWFERDFPTHYMRLIKGVSVTVIALVPPTEGIKATLTHLGTSRTLRKNSLGFETVEIKRGPESVALSSPLNATGVFLPLIPNQPTLNPFEGNGLEGTWLFELPKGSNSKLNYDTIVDVHLTLSYTSLDDPLKQPLYPMVAQSSLNYGLKLSFPDDFYHLLNPNFYADEYGFEQGKTHPPYTIRIKIDGDRLPPNQRNRRLQSITILVQQKGEDIKQPIISFRHIDSGTTVLNTNEINDRGYLRVENLNINDFTGDWELSLLNDDGIWSTKVGLDPSNSTLSELQNDPRNLFDWHDDNGTPEPKKINDHSVLILTWLKDVLIMFEYDHVVIH